MMQLVHLPQMQPMLASTGPILGSADDYAFEPKLDGWRALVYVDGTVVVRTRNGRNISEALPELLPLSEALGGRVAVLDGELVAHEGRARDFYRLGPRLAARRRVSVSRGQVRSSVTFVVFDVLYLDGAIITDRPYAERRALLEQLHLLGPAWCTVSSFPGLGAELFAACVELELEGLVAKRLDGPYRPGDRSRFWVKAKTADWRNLHGPLRHSSRR